MDCMAFTVPSVGIQNRLISEAYIISGNEQMYTKSALWDTGATCTCISRAVVDRLGLKSVGKTMVMTPSGKIVQEQYLVDILLRNNVLAKDVCVTGSEIGVQGLDILIGMDIIGAGDFAVSNFHGNTKFTFRIPSIEDIDFVKQIENEKK